MAFTLSPTGLYGNAYAIDLCRGHDRILIAGGPSSGKTLLAEQISLLLGRQVFHTDDTMGGPGDARFTTRAQFIAGNWLGTSKTIIEGVLVSNALSIFLATEREPPADIVLVLNRVYGRTSRPREQLRSQILRTIDALTVRHPLLDSIVHTIRDP